MISVPFELEQEEFGMLIPVFLSLKSLKKNAVLRSRVTVSLFHKFDVTDSTQ